MRGQDEKFMGLALSLAEGKARRYSPNPRVGALVVRSGRIVGKGGTGPFGGPHAEAAALREAGPLARGATLYVTLEPCSHQGKTPPCAVAVAAAGIRRVVAAVRDPFPLVRGRGFAYLRRKGVALSVGVMEREARDLNDGFFFSVERGRPKVVLKAALSLDGKSAPPAGKGRWITGPAARRRARRMRSEVDAVLVGRGTVRADDPALTVRLPGLDRKDGWPLRVVLDKDLRTAPGGRLFQGPERTLFFASPSAPRSRQRALERAGADVFRVPLAQKMLSLKAVLRVLHRLQVRSLLVEGGSLIHDSFLKQGLVEEVRLFFSPKVLGRDAQDWLGPGRLGEVLSRLRGAELERVGGDMLLTGRWKG